MSDINDLEFGPDYFVQVPAQHVMFPIDPVAIIWGIISILKKIF